MQVNKESLKSRSLWAAGWLQMSVVRDNDPEVRKMDSASEKKKSCRKKLVPFLCSRDAAEECFVRELILEFRFTSGLVCHRFMRTSSG